MTSSSERGSFSYINIDDCVHEGVLRRHSHIGWGLWCLQLAELVSQLRGFRHARRLALAEKGHRKGSW